MPLGVLRHQRMAPNGWVLLGSRIHSGVGRFPTSHALVMLTHYLASFWLESDESQMGPSGLLQVWVIEGGPGNPMALSALNLSLSGTSSFWDEAGWLTC